MLHFISNSMHEDFQELKSKAVRNKFAFFLMLVLETHKAFHFLSYLQSRFSIALLQNEKLLVRSPMVSRPLSFFI